MSIVRLRFLIMVVLFSLSVPPIRAGNISGGITSDTTWTLSGSPVVVTGSATVLAGVSLTIEPGVTVRFTAGTSLVVAGKLVAGGSSGQEILFTSDAATPASGDWGGIEFQNTANVGSVFSYCIVEFGGAGVNASNIFYKTGAFSVDLVNCTIRYSSSHGVNTRASSPKILKSVLYRNGGYGIYSDLLSNFLADSCTIYKNTSGGVRIPTNSTPKVTNCVVDTNGTGIFIDNSATPLVRKNYVRLNAVGIQFTGIGPSPTIDSNVIAGNSSWGFLNTGTFTVKAERNYWGSDQGPYNPSLNPSGRGDNVSSYVDFQPWNITGGPLPVKNITASISVPTTWYRDTVYWVKNSITVSSTLTINPGTIVKFALNARMTVSGTIVANGAADTLIVFTSDKDDSYGGDSNGDGGTTGPNPNDWDMLYLYTGGNNSSVLNNCILKFGGYSGNGNLDVYNASPSLSNLYVTNGSGYGITIYYSSSTLTNITSGGNGYVGIYLYSTTLTLVNANISGNGNIGIWGVSGSRLTILRSNVSKNGSTGINVDGGASNATIVLLDSCVVSGNNGTGIYNWSSTGPQTFSNSRIDANQGVGLWCYNLNDTVRILADTIVNNRDEGIGTSKAFIANNIIQGNRYPIALIGRVNSTYSGNTISGNKYNNAVALRLNREDLSDTLKTTLPAGMTSKTYVLIENSRTGVVTGATLVIQPGVTIKMEAGLTLTVDGTLIANGTSTAPIVFTSYRDTMYGGKTNLATDNAAPAPNDWGYIRFNTNSISTILRNCIFKYGGRYGIGNVYFYYANFTNPVDSIVSRKSSSMGIDMYNAQLTFANVTLDSNGTYGMYIEGSNPRADVIVRNSIIVDNGSTGLQAVDNSTFREVSNCIIRRNNGNGIGVNNGTIPQAFFGNNISSNNGNGIYTNSPSVLATDLQFIGNTITDHPGEGVISTRSRFIDNTIQRNRFPIGVWGRMGNIYVDNNGVDGNVISDNVYNAVAIRNVALSDTLVSRFPAAVTSRTYVVIEDIQVNNGTTLVIEPGVIIKFQPLIASGYRQFNINGTLIADATPAQPIVFTSWRDSTIGGKTTTPTDFVPPAPGDWYYLAFRNGSGASIIRYCRFKYGGRGGSQTLYFESNLGGMIFSNNLVRKSSGAGIYVNSTPLVIDSTTVDSCGQYGVRLTSNALNNVRIQNSSILSNGSLGLWAQSPSNFSVISNCTVSDNGDIGIYVEGGTVPTSIVGNTVANNRSHGIYVIARNDAIDTLLLIAGNKIRNNTLAGLFSSRAYVTDDSLSGNRYGIGVVGQLNLFGTGNTAGNVYSGNFIAGNLYEGTIVTEGTSFGLLGGTYPAGYTSKVIAVRGNLYVAGGTTLTIAPGTIIKFPIEWGRGRFQVDGTLKSEGTSGSKIVLTSWKDDTYGGDTNKDTTATVPTPGDWDMLYLNGSGNNTSHLLHTIVRYGGGYNDGEIRLDNNNASIESCFVSFSYYHGIRLFSSSPTISGSEIHSNQYGISVYDPSNPVINYNNIRDNTTGGLYSTSSSKVNARYNYWGAASGPFVNQGDSLNLAGTGNRIVLSGSALVGYLPYLTSRSGILFGDVSGNGSITAYDASLILQYLVGSISLSMNQRTAANVSGDTSVSAFDASLILRYVVGLISGFPGLGKTTTDAQVASAFAFRVEKGAKDGECVVVIRLLRPTDVYSAEVAFGFDSTEVSAMGVLSTPLTDSMSLVYNLPSGKVHVALAGLYPLKKEGDVLRIVFRMKDEAKRKEGITLSLNKFVLNEQNVTSSFDDIVLDVRSIFELPTRFEMGQNYPNPFNPVTRIRYQLPSSGRVTLKIYDLLGREVKLLVNEEQLPGYYTIAWDGKDAEGRSVASGVYIYRIEASTADKQNFTEVKKMLMLR